MSLRGGAGLLRMGRGYAVRMRGVSAGQRPNFSCFVSIGSGACKSLEKCDKPNAEINIFLSELLLAEVGRTPWLARR